MRSLRFSFLNLKGNAVLGYGGRGRVILTDTELKRSRSKRCTRDTKFNLEVKAGAGISRPPSASEMRGAVDAAALEFSQIHLGAAHMGLGREEVRLLSGLRILSDPRKKPESRNFNLKECRSPLRRGATRLGEPRPAFPPSPTSGCPPWRRLSKITFGFDAVRMLVRGQGGGGGRRERERVMRSQRRLHLTEHSPRVCERSLASVSGEIPEHSVNWTISNGI